MTTAAPSFDAKQFERAAAQRLAEFQNPNLRKARPTPQVSCLRGSTVILAVRQRRHGAWTDRYVHESSHTCELLAQFEAEKAARAAGWPYVAYVVSIKPKGE